MGCKLCDYCNPCFTINSDNSKKVIGVVFCTRKVRILIKELIRAFVK